MSRFRRVSAWRRIRWRLLHTSALVPALAMVGASSAFAQAVNLGRMNGNTIVPDGRTRTTLRGSGTTTNIRSSTYAGGNAYNSFDTFQEGPGNTVNLRARRGTKTIVNVVRSSAVDIEGTLNSYKGRKIGGNVVFADPYGFVVGPHGTVNVGGLTVVTPSGATLDQVIDSKGHVNQALAAQVIGGDVPLSPDGSVVIQGQINAKHFVRVTAHDVEVAGSLSEAKRAALHKAQFQSTVNAGGLVEGGSIVVRNGSIRIVAANDGTIGGRLSANGTRNHGGSIALSAGHQVDIAPTARVTAAASLKTKRAAKNTPTGPDTAPTIQVNAGDTATIAGTLKVGAAPNGLAGQIGVVGHDIDIASTAAFVAQGNGTTGGGHISIKADDDTTVAAGARFTANALGTGDGGFVEISAKNKDTVDPRITLDLKAKAGKTGTLLFDPDVLVISDGTPSSDPNTTTMASLYTHGANVELDATTSITVSAVIDTRAYAGAHVAGPLAANTIASTGNSGSITLSAPTITISSSGALYADVNNVGNTTYTAGAITLATSAGSNGAIAVNGKVYGGAFIASSYGGTVTIAGSVASGGGAVDLEGGSVTLSGTVDSRNYIGTSSTPLVAGTLSSHSTTSRGSSGAVTVTAPTINVQSGSAVYADANGGGYSAGDVTLTATTSSTGPTPTFLGPASATSSIAIAGTIAGGAISATSTSTASLNYTATPTGYAAIPATALGGFFLGVNGGYVAANASARVTVSGTIQGSGAVTLSTVGSETAVQPVITLNSGAAQTAIAAGVILGEVDADVKTEVQGSATISSGGALTVSAVNAATLNITAFSASVSSSVGATIAYSTGTLNTSALVDSGASITKAASVTVAAQTTNSFSTSASSLAAGNASAGIAIAISDIHTNATANLGAGIASSAGTKGVTVYSGSNTTLNTTQASTTVGSPALIAGILTAATNASDTVGKLFNPGGLFADGAVGQAANAQGTTPAIPKGGLTLSLNEQVQTSTASIAGDTAADAPTIYSTGPVAVVSLLTDKGIHSNASASINSSADASIANPATSGALAMAVDAVQITHDSNAFIGSNVHVTGSQIAVDAQTLVPITNTWTDFDGFGAVTSHLNGNLGIVSNILTSYANATADSGTTGISGAVNYFEITNNTTAWVGSGAHLTQIAAAQGAVATDDPSFSIDSNGAATISGTGFSSSFQTVTLPSSVVVKATTETDSIDIGGNFSWLTVFGTNSTSSEGTSVGGSANADIFATNTIAGIGAGAIVSAVGTVSVTANTKDLVYGVAPTAGKGSGLGLNGIVSVLEIDNTTSASISSSAQITAAAVSIAAQQDLSTFDIAGAVGASKGAGIGIVAAVASISTNTSAYIGDNSTVLPSAASADDFNVTTTQLGAVTTSSLSVSGLSVGRLTTASVAAEFSNNAPNPADTDMVLTSPSDASYLAKAVAFFARGAEVIADKIANLSLPNQNLVNGTNSISGAGSTSVDLTAIATSASITGTTVNVPANATNTSVSVQALNNTIINTASGAAAIALGAPGTNYAVGIAGAVAVGLSNDSTTATISTSTIHADQVAVQALAGGQNTAVGLAAALTSGVASSSAAVSASVSFDEIGNRVNALVDSSTLSGGASSSAGALSISADQKTEIGIGAGSLALNLTGGGAGIGVALTYAKIGDPDGASAVSAILSNSSVQWYQSLTVQALDQSRIVSGAAVASGGVDTTGFSGSIIVNDISPSIVAEIFGTPTISGTTVVTNTITVSGDVQVIASGGSNATLDSTIDNAALNANGSLTPVDDSHVDFSASAASPSSGTGAAIIGVAGQVAAGKSNVGISLVVDQIAQSHIATVDGVSLTSTGGVVSVSAKDDAEILGVAFGASIANGSTAGVGSVVYNGITDGVIAQIGHEDATSGIIGAPAATVEAGAVRVYAEDGSDIRGAAGALALNIGGGDAIGLSMTINQISNYVVAETAGSHVTIDESVTDSSPLLSSQLSSGSLLVSGESNANITAISIGTAISLGNNPAGMPNATPQQNLATLVAGLKPSAPTNLASRGGSAAYFNKSPPTPPQPSGPPSDGLSGAGSIVVSTEASTVTADIAQGARSVNSTINANNNVVVEAANNETIDAYSGAASVSYGSGKSIGISVVVSEISSATNAYIDQSTVDAHALGSAASVDNGTLSSSVNPSTAVTPGAFPSFSDGTNSVDGIAIVSTSKQRETTVAVVVSLSNSNSADSANAVTDTMGGTTQAYASNSNLNTLLSSGQNSAIQVTAASVSFANNLDIGASAGSLGAGTIALLINKMDRTTNASITNSTVGSSAHPAGAVAILANAWEGTSAEVIGVAASQSSGFAGSALVNLFSAQTAAAFEGGTNYATSLAVNANTTDGYFGTVGAVAGSPSGGVGASVLVATLNNATSATVGDPADTTATTLHLSGPLTVAATTTSDTQSYTVDASIGSTAVAAMVTVTEETNATTAQVWDTTATIATTGDGDVNVTATENDSIGSLSGGVGAGTSGIGASVNLVILRSNDLATLSADTITTPGAVNVGTNVTRDVDPITVTGGLGTSAGFAATVGVVLVGQAASSAEIGVLNQGGLLDSASTVSTSAGNLTATAELAGTSCASGQDCMSASIINGSGNTITAGSVDVSTTSKTDIFNVVGTLAAGVQGGFGAAVGYTDLDQRISANTFGGTIVTPSLTISAYAGDDPGAEAHSDGRAVRTLAVAGTGGLYVGLGAAVAVSTANDTVTAQVGSTVNDGPSSTAGVTAASTTVLVAASDTSTALADAYGASVGLAAVGASVATATRSSTVTAEALSSATIGAQTVTIQASESGATYALGIGGAAGAVAGTGVDASATDNGYVYAQVDAGATIAAIGTSTGGGLAVNATDNPDAKAFAFGVSVGVAAAGVSISDAEATSHVNAYVDGGAHLGQTVGLTVSATSNATGTLATSFPASATVPGSTIEFTAGETTAAAWSIAGSGGIEVAADATDTTANSSTNVKAETGAGLRLPSGAISVKATNTTNQFAQGTGVTLSEGYAFGAVVSKAKSSPTTTAKIDSSTLSTAMVVNASNVVTTLGTQTVTVSATGSDNNNAMALAGAGGAVAGNGAAGTTEDNSTVIASIGDSSNISAEAIAVNAKHNDTFAEMGNTLNASALGASAAYSSHTANSDVEANVGANVTLAASAAGQPFCSGNGCTAAISLAAENDFTDNASGTKAAAGGGINGAGATSTIDIDQSSGGASISVGAGDHFVSGTDANLAPGSIALIAQTNINVSDQDTLYTGGLIEGAGVNSTIDGTLNNTITIGAGASLATYGSLNLATYTMGNVSANSYVSTYGVAAVGVADANIGLTENETINVLAGSNIAPTALAGFYNVYITAGEDLTHAASNRLSGSTSAQGYVRGLIAVPTADATTSITSNATVDLQPGTDVFAGQNVSIDAYHGAPTANADGTGHGYELLFIPVTDGSSHNPITTTSNVTIDGTVVAGEYSTLALTVNADGTVSENAGGAPVSITYLANPTVSCAAGITSTCLFTASEYQTLLSHGDVSSGNIAAIRFGSLFASGGNIEIKADTLHGGGSITAQGNPSITVTDAQNIALVFYGGAIIPNIPAGVITYTGMADAAAARAAGIHPTSTGTSTSGAITISQTYANAGNGEGPPIIVDAPITNLGGSVVINDAKGSLVYQTIYQYDSSGNVVRDKNNNPVAFSIGGTQGNQVLITVPYGAMIVDAGGSPDGSYIVGSSPADEFASSTIYPGGINGTDGNGAVEYVASSIFQNNLRTTDGLSANAGAPNEINAYLYGHGGNYTNESIQDVLVLYGTCGIGSASAPCASSGFNIDRVTQPLYYNQTLYYSAGSAQEYTAGSATSKQIYGNLIEVNAATIDLNGALYAGPGTTYNLSLSSNTGTVLSQLTYLHNTNYYGNQQAVNAVYNELFQEIGYSNQLPYLTGSSSIDVTSLVTFGSTSATDVTATFNFATQQITISPIEAHSIGASVTLDGAIISSNTLGNIHVNSGFGQVSVDNETGYSLVVQGINTGTATNASAATSTVMIRDRLSDSYYNNGDYWDTTTYIYNPASGLKVYKSSYGTDPVDANGNLVNYADSTLLYTSSGSTATFNPVAGAAYKYVQEAQLARTIYSAYDSFSGSSNWYFLGNPNQPYYYVDPSYLNQNPNPVGPQTVAPASAQSTAPVGQVIVESPSAPAFQETIYGNILRGGQSGCGHYYNCLYAYNNNDQAQGEYLEYYPDRAFVRITTTERADNPVAITFTGNTTAYATITSNASVTIAGDIKNPNGATTINTQNGGSSASITQTVGSTLSGNSISLTAGGGIGTPATPLVTTLTNGLGSAPGSFYAYAHGGGVYAQLNSSANGFSAYALAGDVVVRTTGTLTPGQSDHVYGNNITLTSTQGGIGSASAPLNVQLVNGGALNVSAFGDIGLTDVSGDLRIGQIASTTGNVAITVANGNVYDARSQTSASSLSTDQVNAIATALHLTGTSDADAGSSAITNFQNLVTSDLSTYGSFVANGTIATGGTLTIALDTTTYGLYSPLANATAIQSLRANQTGTSYYTTLSNDQIQTSANSLAATNGLFTLSLTSANRAGYQAQAAAALGIADPTTVSDTQIQAWANAKYQAYATTFSQAYGANWKSTVAGPSAPTSFTVAGSANSAALTTMLTSSANWTPQQLVQAIDRSALQPTPTTVGSAATADIIGHNVSLTTASGAIGAYNPNGLQISFQQLTSGTLSNSDQAALAVATSPGSVTLVGHDVSGNALPAGTGIRTLAPGSTVTAINISQTQPVFINTTGALTVSSSASVYLQGTSGSSIALNQVTAQGDINIQAPGGITVATSNGQPLHSTQIVASGNLSLVAGTGSIGTQANPLAFQIGGSVVNASAATDSYLSAINVNARIQRDFAGGTASITTGAGYSILSDLSGVNVRSTDLVLTSGGTIGTGTTAFAVEASGTLSGSAAGLANINAPSLGGGTANNLAIGSFTAGGNATVASSDTLSIKTLLDSTAGNVSTTSNVLTMAAPTTMAGSNTLQSSLIQAAGTVTISTLGDATIGLIQSAYGAQPNMTNGSVSISAGGSVLTYANQPQNIVTSGFGHLTLVATNAIGTLAALPNISAAPITINATNLVVSATATNGSVSLVGGPGLLDVNQVQAGGQVLINADSLTLGTATSVGTQTIGAAGSVAFTTLTSTGADIGVTSSAGAISGTTVTAYRNATLSAYGDDKGASTTGTSVTATTGSVTLSSTTGQMAWSSVTAGTTIGATATAGGISLGTATSIGTQTIQASGDILFTTLKTTGTGNNAGSIGVTSTSGTIAAQVAGTSLIQSAASATVSGKVVTLDTVTAAANATIMAQTTLSGTQLTTTSGFASLTAGTSTSLTPTIPTTLAWTTVSAGTTFGAQAYGGSITNLGTVTSGGTQTIGATSGVTFGTLTAATGDIGIGATTINGTQATATLGGVTLTSSGTALDSIHVATLGAGTAIAATATAGGIDLGTATSAGTQTLQASGDIAFTTLKTTGTGNNAGSIGVTSTSGTIAAQVAGTSLIQSAASATVSGKVVTLDTVTAAANATIMAQTTLSGTQLTTTSGFASLTAGTSTSLTPTIPTTLAWTTVSAGTTFGAQAYGGSITNLGTVTSGGTQTIGATSGVTFGTLTAATGDIGIGATTINGTQATATLGGVTLTSSGTALDSIHVATLGAGTAIAATATAGGIDLGTATSAGTQTLQASGDIAFTTLKTTGTGNNAGSIGVTSTSGTIAAQVAGTSLIQSAAAVTVSGKMVALDTVTAAANATIMAQTTLSGTQLTTTSGFASLTAGVSTSLSPVTPTTLSWTTVSAGTTFGAQAYGGSITNLGTVTSGGLQTIGATSGVTFGTLTAATSDIGIGATTINGTQATATAGAVALTSSGTALDSIHVATLGAGTTIAATATAGGINLGTGTSVGTQTIQASGDILFTTLKTTGTGANAGSIGVTSTSGTIAAQVAGTSLIQSAASATVSGKVVTLDTVTAAANATIMAQTALSGTQLTTTRGFASLTAGVSTSLSPVTPTTLSWTTVNAGTTFGAQAYGGSITTLGTVTSGGTQTIAATNSVTFGTLTANAGDIGVTSSAGAIAGTTVTAYRNATLSAYGDNTGTSLTTQTGSASLTSTTGQVHWTTVNAATTFDATASGGGITLVTATTGGTQTLQARDNVLFTKLTTTGLPGDAGSITITSQTGAVRGQPGLVGGQSVATSLVQANADVTINGQSVTLDTVTTLGSATLVSQGNLSGTSLTTGGDATIVAGALSWQTMDIGGSLNLSIIPSSTTQGFGGPPLVLGTITTGRSQTIGSVGDILFTALTSRNGDVDVTSSSGAISGTTVSAAGSAVLAAADDNIGTTVTAGAGGVSLSSTTGQIAWTNVTAATTLTARATTGRVVVTAARSGTASLSAGGDVTISTMTTTTGDASLVSSGGAINMQSANIAAALTATAASGGITIGTATSGGSQSLAAQTNLVFSQLTTTGFGSDPGNVTLRGATGAIHGGSIAAHGAVDARGVGIIFDTIAAPTGLTLVSGADITGTAFTTNGNVSISAAGTTSLGSVSGGAVTLASPGTITINDLTIKTAAKLAATDILIGVLHQDPDASGPLTLSLTGYKGSIGDNAVLYVDAPNGIVITKLREDPVTLTTNARQVAIQDAIVLGTMRLTTAVADLWFNPTTSQPVLGSSVQIYRPDGHFYLTQDNNVTATNAYVVQYDATAAIQQDVGGVLYYGPSFVRDFDRMSRVGNPLPGYDPDGTGDLWSFPVEAFDRHLANLRDKTLKVKGHGPAVALPPMPDDADRFDLRFKRASR